MKYELTALEYSEIDLQMKILIDSFNMKEINNFLKQQKDVLDGVKTSFILYLLNKIDENLENAIRELQNNSQYDCSQLLISVKELMEIQFQFRLHFKSYEHLIHIIEYTDDLLIYEQVLSILKYFNGNLQQNLTLRILYFQKIIYDHVNSLASRKIELIDFYYQDPKYKTITSHPIEALQFDIEYYRPTQLEESYEYLSQNQIHKISQEGEIEIKKITIIDNNSTSAFNLSRNLLNDYFQSQNKPEISLSNYIQNLQNFLYTNQSNQNSIKYFHQNFEWVDNFHLFKLQTIDTLVLKELLLTYSKNINYLYSQKKDKELLELFSDVFSMQNIEKNEQIIGYPLRYSPQIMTERLAGNDQITSSILMIFTSPIFNRRFLVKNQFANQTFIILKKGLSIQDNKLMLPPQQLIAAIQLLGFLSQCQDFNRNNQIFDYLLIIAEQYINLSLTLQKPTENGYIQICLNEADEIIQGFIQALSECFDYNLIINQFGQQNILNNNLNRNSILGTKILNSNLFGIILSKLQSTVQLKKSILITFQLVKLFKVDPELLVNVINTNLPDFLNEIIQKINIVELETDQMIDILDFYLSISLEENGYQKFYNHGINFIKRLLYYHLITREQINHWFLVELGTSIKFYIQDSINKEQSIALINQIVLNVLQLSLQQLSDKQNQLNYDQNFKSEYLKIFEKKREIECFLFTLSWENNILLSEGYFEIFVMIFKIPQFNTFKFFGLDPQKCLEKALELIESWETELGCSLNDAKFLFSNEQQFLEKCSPQNYQVTSRFSEILHYFNQVRNKIQNMRLNDQTFNVHLINKCMEIFEILIISQFWIQEEKIDILNNGNHPCAYLLVIIIVLITKIQDKNKIAQSVSKFFSKISLLLKNIPEITPQIFKQIIFLLEFFQAVDFEILDFIINSDIGQNLQDSLKNYIITINSVNQNLQIIQDFDKNFLNILKLLYGNSRQNHSLSTKRKMIQDISNLILIIQDSQHENIEQIKQFLLIQGYFMQSQNFMDLKRNNRSINSERRDQLRKQLENIEFESQYINLILNLNPHELTAFDFLNFEAMNRQHLDKFIIRQNLQILNNRQQIDETDKEHQLIEIEQESLRIYLKKNTFFFSNSLLGILEKLDIQFYEQELFQFLELIVDRSFNLKLNFTRITQDKQYFKYHKMQILIKQKIFSQDQDLLIIEFLKLLDVLLKKEDEKAYQAIFLTLVILNKLNTDNKQILAQILKGTKCCFDSNVSNHSTPQICIDILVRLFQKERQYINLFIFQMNGLEALLKLKGKIIYTQFLHLSKLAMAIIYDQTLVRVQFETQIKKILFNQEQNIEIQKTHQNLQQQNYQNLNTYPICFQPVYYNVQANQQLKITKNHPALLALQKENIYQEDFKYIMNLLFEESVNDEYLVLKQGIALDTLNSINQNGDSILQFNFKHKQETQTLLRLLVQQMIRSYFENNQQYQYNWKTIFDVLKLIIQKFPILLPQLLRINCSKFLEKYINFIGSKISFLTILTRILNPSRSFIFYICLDNLVLFRKSDNIIVPFAYEIRRLVIRELFVEINKSIQYLDEKVCRLSDILVTLLQIKSVAKICIQNINEPFNSFNFIKTYIDGIKSFNMKQYFIFKNQLFFIIKTLNILYSVAINLILDKTESIKVDSFQMNSEEIKQQIFQNLMSHFQDGVIQNPNISNLVSQKWPLLTIKKGEFDDYFQIEEEQEIPSDQQIIIENYENSHEILAAALEQESINWVDENDQVTENFHSNNLGDQYTLHNLHIDDKSDQSLWKSGFFNIDLNIQLPFQFQKILIKFQSIFNNKFQKEEIYLNQMDQVVNIANKNYENDILQIRDQEEQFQLFIQQEDELLQDQLEDQNQQKTYSIIKNKIKSVLNNRKQSLKLLGLVDRQFLQLIIQFLQVDDNFESQDNYINQFLMNLGTSSLIANQIIDYLINNLKMIRQQDFDQEMFIITRNQIVSDQNYFSKFISPKILQTLLKIKKASKCCLSSQNFETMTQLLFKLEEKDEELLIQVLSTSIKNQQLIDEVNVNLIHDLFNLLMKAKNKQKILKLIKFVSILLKNKSNFIRFKVKIQNQLKKFIMNFEKYLLERNTNDQITDQEDGIKKIFQLIQQHIYYNFTIGNTSQENEWLEFLKQPELQQLWMNMEKIISNIQPQQVQEYNLFLLPYIESFLICTEIVNQNETQSYEIIKLSSMELSSSSQDHIDFNFKKLFKKLSQNGKDYINSIIIEQIEFTSRQQNNQSKKRSLVEYFLQFHPNIINFEVKKEYLRYKIDPLRSMNQEIQLELFLTNQQLTIYVNMDTVFEDSYRQISALNTNQLKVNLAIKFVGQQAYDHGGLKRHWFQILSKEFLNPKHKLFIHTPNRQFYQINRESYLDNDHLNKFKFVGKIFAKAIMDDCLIHGEFPTYFFKHILGIKLSINDMQDYDVEEHTSMKFIYGDNDISNLDCVYTYCINNKGQVEEKELIQGGKDIQVTDENKKDYIRKYCHQFMAKNIEDQIKAIQEGFYSVIPKNLIAIFDSAQFKKLLCGQQQINVENLIENLSYNKADIKFIKWLQNILRTFNQDMLAKFINFVTGTYLVPAGGFQNLTRPIQIKITNSNSKFPEAYTCQKLLVIPAYDSEEVLREKLELALFDENNNFQRG
ncbi:unnamed protein product [Paramecium sonneborni]|uniref:HECT domain-containing protein n=1 Tax=Paramecium sonneborni TaxID=65129 RepID=A0A8S1RAD8_9CILI|nr:unnamed protein product [Paramecium sonneborni]